MLSRVLFFVLLVIAGSTAAADKVALVLGNGNYTHAEPLRNAANDATDMADTLRRLGFRVYEGVDYSRRDALRLVQDFVNSLNSADTALFFYAGHATQIGTDNFVMPVDVRPGTEDELMQTSIKMQSILASMETRAATRIVILDACRNNPFLRSGGSNRSVSADRGLFKMDAGVGSYIAYSTEPGNVATDGTGRNSPFTAALLQHITQPGRDIHSMMRSVRADVIDASGSRQTPWENSALIDEVYLAAAPPQAVQPSVPEAPVLQRRASAGETCGPVNMLGSHASLCASSTLSSQSGNSYRGANLLDNNPATAWVEGQSDAGVGAYLAIDFDMRRDVKAIDLLNGYTKSQRLFYRNGRVQELRVTGSNGVRTTVILRDDWDWQRVHLSGFEDLSWIQLEVGSVYPGSHYEDTALSELRLH
ncbi:MAG: caspase family protein [Pseudomonadota bacterium]